MYEFVDFIFRNKLNKDFEKKIKIERIALENTDQKIEVLDLGAGMQSIIMKVLDVECLMFE